MADHDEKDDLKFSDTAVWGGAIVVVAFLVWLVTISMPNLRVAMAAGGDAVAAVAAIASSLATIFAVQQLRLQREAMADQRRALVDDHRLQHLAVLREKYAEYLKLCYEAQDVFFGASLAFHSTQGVLRDAARDRAHASLMKAYRELAAIALLDEERARVKVAECVLTALRVWTALWRDIPDDERAEEDQADQLLKAISTAIDQARKGLSKALRLSDAAINMPGPTG